MFLTKKEKKWGSFRGGESGRISIFYGEPQVIIIYHLFFLSVGRKVLQVYKYYLFVYWMGKVPSERRGCFGSVVLCILNNIYYLVIII